MFLLKSPHCSLIYVTVWGGNTSEVDVTEFLKMDKNKTDVADADNQSDNSFIIVNFILD